METPPFEDRLRQWLLPRSTVLQLGLALTRLAIAGLIAIGISGGLAGLFGSTFGRSFVAGDPPGVTNTPARCVDYLEYAPGAGTCEEAATWHHYGETVQYRLGAGVFGLILLAPYAFARRRLRGDPTVLPPGFEATVGTTMYAAAAAYLLATSFDGVVLHETAGVGGPLSGGIVASGMAVVYGVALYRTLLGRTDRGRLPARER